MKNFLKFRIGFFGNGSKMTGSSYFQAVLEIFNITIELRQSAIPCTISKANICKSTFNCTYLEFLIDLSFLIKPRSHKIFDLRCSNFSSINDLVVENLTTKARLIFDALQVPFKDYKLFYSLYFFYSLQTTLQVVHRTKILKHQAKLILVFGGSLNEFLILDFLYFWLLFR